MAIETQFTCSYNPEDFLTVDSTENDLIRVDGDYEGDPVVFLFDIPTAIKLSKTIRTHINKVKGI